MAMGGVGEAMLVGAITGAGTSAITGNDPLKGALLGAAGGGLGAGVGGALGGQAATQAGTAATTQAGTAATTQAGTAAATQAGTAATTQAGTAVPSAFESAANSALSPSAVNPAQLGPTNLAAQTGQMAGAAPVPQVGFKDLMTPGGSDFSTKLGNYLVQNPMQVGTTAGTLSSSFMTPDGPEKEDYSGPLDRFKYDPDKYTSTMARGGLADTAVAKRFMRGGHLGSYSDGGRLLKGPGDGMSDNIPAKIGSRQPARLADGEFVVPADVVSGIGNGSTDAGARKLYAMMDKVRKARTGSKKQGKEIKSSKYMPA
jgi:hypothetical protein